MGRSSLIRFSKKSSVSRSMALRILSSNWGKRSVSTVWLSRLRSSSHWPRKVWMNCLPLGSASIRFTLAWSVAGDDLAGRAVFGDAAGAGHDEEEALVALRGLDGLGVEGAFDLHAIEDEVAVAAFFGIGVVAVDEVVDVGDGDLVVAGVEGAA